MSCFVLSPNSPAIWAAMLLPNLVLKQTKNKIKQQQKEKKNNHNNNINKTRATTIRNWDDFGQIIRKFGAITKTCTEVLKNDSLDRVSEMLLRIVSLPNVM